MNDSEGAGIGFVSDGFTYRAMNIVSTSRSNIAKLITIKTCIIVTFKGHMSRTIAAVAGASLVFVQDK